MSARMSQQIDEQPAEKVTWPQWIGGVGVTLLLFQIGLMGGWSSPYIAQMTKTNSTLTITMTEATWIVSSLNLGRLSGAIIGSTLVNYLGSKTTILLTSTPMAMCWLCTIVANSAWWLIGSRFAGGFGIGMAYSCFPLYIAEIAEPSIRGALITLGICGISCGNMIMCIIGAYLNMMTTGIISLFLCFILMTLFLWLPESPHHLVRRGNTEMARLSVLWYHRGCDVERELASIREFIESSNSGSFLDPLKEFRHGAIRKALFVSLALYAYCQMSGPNNIVFYMENILRDARVDVIAPSTIVIIVMGFGIGASLLSVFLIDRYGRRCLMCTSCLLVSISVGGLGAQFQLIDLGIDAGRYQWLPISSLVLFQVAVYVGILSVPSTITSELFPANVKCLAACISSFCAGLFSFVSTASYQPLINGITIKYTLWLYGLVVLTAIPVTLIFLPETKGKSLQQIQNELMKRKDCTEDRK